MSRRTRRILPVLLVALASLFVIGLGGWLAFGPPAVRPGMARSEVETKYGPADGNMIAVGPTPVAATTLVWKDRGLVVEFDEADRVRTVSRPPSLFDNLRAKLGL
jgi:hypothetical protein